MKKFTLKGGLAVLAASMLMASNVYAENSITTLNGFMYVEGMSANGRYVAGYDYENGFLYDSETGEITNIISSPNGCEIKGVSNDGVVVGSKYTDAGAVAYVWKDGVADTTLLQEIEVGQWGYRSLTCISSDGSLIAGYTSSGWDGTPYLIKDGVAQELPLPATDMDGLVFTQAVPMGFSDDNRYLLARLCNDWGYYRVGLWDLENLAECEIINFLEPVENWDSSFSTPSLQPTVLTHNGKILCYDDIDLVLYAYDIATKEASIIESPSGSYPGQAFGDYYITCDPAWGLMRTSYIYGPNGEVTAQDFFLNNYEVDIIGSGFADSGTISCVSSDAKCFAAFTYTSTYDAELGYYEYDFMGYHIKLDESARVNFAETLKAKPVVVAADGIININGINGDANVSIVDMSGRTCAKAVANGSAQYRLNSGAYIVKVSQGNANHIYKVVVK